jgi:CRISPR/Cas system-associated endonuclease Cas1
VSNNLLFLAENGAALQVRRGSLCVRAADGTETLYAARVHGVRVIILAGRGGSITDEAIRWAGREGVALYLMCLNGEAFAVLGEAIEADHRRRGLASRQKQFRAVLDPRKRLDVARSCREVAHARA